MMPTRIALDRTHFSKGTPYSHSLLADRCPTKAATRKIVFVGDVWDGSTSGMRLETLRRLGHPVQAVLRAYPQRSLFQRLLDCACWKLGYPRDQGLNEAILSLLSRNPADILWCDRPLDLRPDTLERTRKLNPAIKFVAYSLDDMAGSHNQSAYYLKSIPLYDLHVTTKSYNVDELKALGARKVLFVNNAFCPFVHFPVEPTPEEKLRYGGAVGFIGSYERDRADMLAALAKAGIAVRVWGGGWPDRLHSSTPNLRIENQCLWGDSYRTAVNCFDIKLGFLRKLNRDLQTTRSVEVPACGAFLLAERTREHRALFQEDVEAAFFCSTDELVMKVKYYLHNDSVRKTIALNGFRKALGAPYTYEAQLEQVFEKIVC